MIRTLFTAVVLLFAFKAASAQEIVKDTVGTSSVKNDYELPDNQFSDWKSVEKIWYANEYDKIKAENKITLACKTCNSFYMDVIIKVNGNGKMEYYKLTGSNNCGRGFNKAQEIRMMRMFFKFEYPSSLRNTTFKTRLGTALKC
ncbi:MAG: hypothetical protein JWP12_3335 [Bacteroidetes bacterium]|nr:hypothetical protein [Bacteroidota bacterium]